MPSTSTSDAGSRLDLATRSIDLVSTIIKATQGSNSDNVLLEIVHWLGREKLGRDQLENFMAKALGLTSPNKAGYKYLDQVRRHGEAKLTAHLSLRQSGSLGRLLVADPRLCWVPSTIACLYQCHSDKEFVADAVCECILQDLNTHEVIVASSFRSNYLERLQLKAVVDRVVSSVWLCVVNSGDQLEPLPSELRSVCSSGHYLDSQQFGKIVRALQSDYPKFIVRSRFLFLNLVVWLQYHFHGILQVTVSSRIVYTKALGNHSQEIELRVEEFCTESCSIYSSSSTYELLTEIAGDIKCLLRQKTEYPGTRDAIPTSGARQPLYHVQSQNSKETYPYNNMRTKGFEIITRTTAQEIMKWLLNITLVERPDEVRGLSEFGFWAKIEPVADGQRSYKVSDILKSTPTMLNMPWGERPPYPMIFSRNMDDRFGPEPSQIDLDAYFGSAATQKSNSLGIEDVIRYFPILQDMLEQRISPSCKCTECSEFGKVPTSFKNGCLCTMAVTEILVLLGHGIADSFGCPDQSGTCDNELLIELMKQLLVELCRDEMILWNTWFSVAAKVFLGFPSILARDVEAGRTIGVFQYGNIAAIAAWIDFDMDARVRGCFGMMCKNGRLTVRTTPEAYPRSVHDEYAVIYLGGTEHTTSYNKRFPKASVPAGVSQDLVVDQTDITTSMVLVPIRDQVFSLMLIICTSEHRRIIDMSKAVEARRWQSVPACNHGPHQTSHLAFKIPSKMMDLNEIIGRWNGDAKRPEAEPTVLYCSDLLDSALKQNIALALSPSLYHSHRRLVKDCTTCLLANAQELSSKPTSGDLYIIRSSINERELTRLC